MPKVEGADLISTQVDKAKQPTETFKEYSAWLLENTGVKVSATNAQLVSRLYSEFQKQNREAGTGRARGRVRPEAAKPVSDEAAAADATVATPNKRVRKTAAKAPASKTAAKPAGRPRRGKVVASEEAPY